MLKTLLIKNRVMSEMFPGVQPIPLKNIHPNPENPGPALTDQAIQEQINNINVAERGSGKSHQGPA